MKLDLPSSTKEMYHMLSAHNLEFLDYVQSHPESFERAEFSAANTWDDPTVDIVLQPWPVFIDRRFSEAIAEASTRVFSLIKSIPDRIFQFDPMKISEYYKIPKEYAQICMLGVDNKYIDNFLTRGDFIITPQQMKCLEYNVSANLGGWELPLWEAQVLQVPLISQFMKSAQLKITNKNVISLMFQHIIDITLKSFPSEEEINVALSIANEKALKGLKEIYSKINRIYTDCLKQKGKDKGKIILCRYDQLTIKPDSICYENQKVHTIMDYYLGQVPLQFLVQFKMGKVLIYNGPVATILSHKLNLALMSEHEDSQLFTPEERETIRKYIPWTRKIEPGTNTFHGEEIILEDFIITHQKDLVLKPGLDYGGEGVYVGCNTPANQWKSVLEKAIQEENWAIQEYIPTPRLFFQWGEKGAALCDITWGLLVFGNQFAAPFMRALPPRQSHGVVNVRQGAEVPIIFEVEKQV